LNRANLVEQLNTILKQAKDNLTKKGKSSQTSDPLRNVEVEARLGNYRPFSDAEIQDIRTKKSRTFEAGTAKDFFYQAKNAMSHYKGWTDINGNACPGPTERTTYDILYDDSGPTTRKQNVRVEINAMTGKCTGNVVIKRKLNDPIDTEIEQHYDLRVTVANEQPYPLPDRYIQLAEKLFERPSSDLNSSSRLTRMWELMRRGCPVRPKINKKVLMSNDCHQGVSERDELLNLIRKNGNQLDGSTAHRMHWTLLNVDKFRSIDGRDLHRSSSSGHPPMESVTITCLPGKLFKGKTEGKCLGPQ
tara:strand:+ start:102 stop:1010 length:909 start_codon:yes stop_codon:yes gene_type:complete